MKAHLGKVRLSNDPFNANGPNSVPVKLPVGSLEDSLSGFESSFRAFHASRVQPVCSYQGSARFSWRTCR
jgi:hypothetical protein